MITIAAPEKATQHHSLVDARGPPSKDGPCPRASVEEPFVQFGHRHEPE